MREIDYLNLKSFVILPRNKSNADKQVRWSISIDKHVHVHTYNVYWNLNVKIQSYYDFRINALTNAGFYMCQFIPSET